MFKDKNPEPKDFPQDLLWDMYIEVRPQAPRGAAEGVQPDWVQALYHGGDDILPSLLRGEVYHEQVNDQLEVAYAFTYSTDDQGRIIAAGTMHQAETASGRPTTYTDRTIAEAQLVLKPLDPNTTEAIRRYLMSHN